MHRNIDKGRGYNERLFSGGLRRFLHLARFRWFKAELLKLGCPAKYVIELGCFDGKLLQFLPTDPVQYKGFDANWEGGLDLARKNHEGASNLSFVYAETAQEMRLSANERFDIAVALETLEHISPNDLPGYLQVIAQHLDGYFFESVPNEKGVVFLIKWVCKWLIGASPDKYSLPEIWYATIGRMSLIERREHKGFDYDLLLKEISEYFDVVSTVGMPFRVLPKFLSFGIGIVAVTKKSPSSSSE